MSWIKKNHHEIQVATAVCLIIFGMIMAGLGFYVIPIGIIDSSVLWLFGQSLIAGGSLLGIAIPLIGKNKKEEEK